MTVYDFLNMCTEDCTCVKLFDCDTGECCDFNIYDKDDPDFYELMESEAMSWDIGEDGRICINYVKESEV